MKNSVGMLASHHFSHRALTGVRVRDRKAMLDGIGVDWKSLAQEVRQGTFVRREVRDRTVTYFHTKEQVTKTLDLQRHEWTASAAPYFNSVESLGLTPDASTLPGIST